MKWGTWYRRWLPVCIGALVTIALWAFAFFPYRRAATLDMQRVHALERQLQTTQAVLQLLPERKAELDSLRLDVEKFRSGLFRTDQVDDMMRSMEERAHDAGVTFWTLDPSVPTLLRLEDYPDSVAALPLAVLPVEFECFGDFLAVGKFLEAEERRAEFDTWISITISTKNRAGEVRAHGEANFFLLPARNFEGNS